MISKGVGIKSQIGNGFVSLSKSMGGTRKEKWLSLWGDKVTQQNLSDALAKTRWSRKKKTYGYRERDELKRQVFQQQLKTKRPRQIVYVDKPALIIGRNTPMATARLGNASMLLNQANAMSELVGLRHSSRGKSLPRLLFQARATQTYLRCG